MGHQPVDHNLDMAPAKYFSGFEHSKNYIAELIEHMKTTDCGPTAPVLETVAAHCNQSHVFTVLTETIGTTRPIQLFYL